MEKAYVYILSNYQQKTLYIGVTTNLKRRLYEHKNKIYKGFTEKYNVNMLLYFEETSNIQAAIQREKNLKKWNRDWKLDLIRSVNPELRDISDLVTG